MTSPAKWNSYVPAPPVGSTFGFVNIDYQYEIITMNADSSWMFDWGDGTTSPWLQLGNATTSIIQVHRWTFEGNYTVRLKFKSATYPTGIWSNPLLVSISYATITDFPSEPVLISGTVEGINGSLYTYAIKAIDPHGYRMRYRCDWGDERFSNWTALFSSGSPSTIEHRWDTSGNFSMRFQSINEYGLDSPWSMSVPVVIHNTSETNQTTMNLIVLDGIIDYVTFKTDHAGTFFNTTTGVSTQIRWDGEGTYFLDDNNDGKWDYKYTPEEGLLEPIPLQVGRLNDQHTSFVFPWLWIFIILGVIAAVIAIVVVLYKTGYLYFYDEVVEK
jgi:hypothetical protein